MYTRYSDVVTSVRNLTSLLRSLNKEDVVAEIHHITDLLKMAHYIRGLFKSNVIDRATYVTTIKPLAVELNKVHLNWTAN